MSFLAYDLSLDLIRALREPLVAIKRHDADEAKQTRRCVNSVARNIAEGGGRFGADRLHFFAIAYGSLRETRAALDIAVANGWIAADTEAHAVAARLGGMLYRLAGR